MTGPTFYFLGRVFMSLQIMASMTSSAPAPMEIKRMSLKVKGIKHHKIYSTALDKKSLFLSGTLF